jgi:hypothetical protein
LAAGQTVVKTIALVPTPAPAPPKVAVGARAAPTPAAPKVAEPMPEPPAPVDGAGSDDPTRLADDASEDRDVKPASGRWWLWAGAGGVVVAAAVVLLVMRGSGGVSHMCPGSSTGICDPLPPRN